VKETHPLMPQKPCSMAIRKADIRELYSSGIGQTLPHVLGGTNGRNMALYGDLGYGNIGEHLYKRTGQRQDTHIATGTRTAEQIDHESIGADHTLEAVSALALTRLCIC
jgi:hypothetical protein